MIVDKFALPLFEQQRRNETDKHTFSTVSPHHIYIRGPKNAFFVPGTKNAFFVPVVPILPHRAHGKKKVFPNPRDENPGTYNPPCLRLD